MAKNNKRIKNNGRRRPNVSRIASNADGLSFLKCAFASVDFATDSFAGIPDTYGGRSIIKRHRFTTSIQVVAGQDTYLAFLPTPGTAYWSTTVNAGTILPASTNLTGVPFADTQVLFPTGTEGINVNKFRYAGHYMELIPLTNATNWTGSVSVWKGMVNTARATNGDIRTDGLQSLANIACSNYIGGNNLGAYAVAMNTSGEFGFTEIISNSALATSEMFGTLTGKFCGLGNTEAIFVKITAQSAAAAVQYQLRTAQCIEYIVPTSSILYDYTRASASYDPVALAAYRHAANNLPVAVSYFENANFWQTFLALFNRATMLGSNIPGPLGMASGGLNMVGTALQSMLI